MLRDTAFAMPTYRLRSPIPSASPEELFDWHARPGAFHRLNPPWDPVRVVSRTGEGVSVGVELVLEARVGPASVRWTAEHTACERPHGFTDTQRNGPFAHWVHQHRFLAEAGGTVLEDEIDWQAPLGALGAAVGGVHGRLERAFPFRHRRTRDDLGRHARHRDKPRLRVLVSGASGLIGTQLTAFLDAGGHEVTPIVRRRSEEGLFVDFQGGGLDPAALEGYDAVVHLAGAPIADGAWTDARKQVIRDSRVRSTEVLAKALAAAKGGPRVMISGSAVGVYGDAGDTMLTEEAPAGDTFLAEVGRAWEAATRPAEEAGVRVVHLRTGLVLSAQGGILSTLLPMFRSGLGGPIGSGRQFVPWIHLDDELGLIHDVAPGKALDHALGIAGELAAKTPASMKIIKELIKPAPYRQLEDGLRMEYEGFATLIRDDEGSKTLMDAFLAQGEDINNVTG